MAMSTGARSQAGYVLETTYGVTPATPQLIELPFQTFNVNLTREEYDDNTIRGDAMERYSLSGNKSIGGTIDVNLAHAVYDDLFASALRGAFASLVLKKGQTRSSMTLEYGQLDIGQYVAYNGCEIDKFTVTVPSSGVVTASFDLVGKSQTTMSTTTIDTSAGYTLAPARRPFTDNGAAGFFKEGGATTGVITNLSFTVDNGLNRNFSLGTDVVRDVTPGMSKVTGSMTVFFEDAVIYNKFINGSSSSIDFKLDDGTNTMQFFMPNVKYTGSSRSSSGQGPVTMTVPFKALYDATANSHLVITRSA